MCACACERGSKRVSWMGGVVGGVCMYVRGGGGWGCERGEKERKREREGLGEAALLFEVEQFWVVLLQCFDILAQYLVLM
mmetsp:Transcript_29472/g.76091  ORF Transcript_29472/g.76091 Transcript_29472/m.76091 type:complete len:80 (-) Transcript_29472:810-1049(-)